MTLEDIKVHQKLDYACSSDAFLAINQAVSKELFQNPVTNSHVFAGIVRDMKENQVYVRAATLTDSYMEFSVVDKKLRNKPVDQDGKELKVDTLVKSLTTLSMMKDSVRVICFGPYSRLSHLQNFGEVVIERFFVEGKLEIISKYITVEDLDELRKDSKKWGELIKSLNQKRNNDKKTLLDAAIVQSVTVLEEFKALKDRLLEDYTEVGTLNPAFGAHCQKISRNIPFIFQDEWESVDNLRVAAVIAGKLQQLVKSPEMRALLLRDCHDSVLMEISEFEGSLDNVFGTWGMHGDWFAWMVRLAFPTSILCLQYVDSVAKLYPTLAADPYFPKFRDYILKIDSIVDTGVHDVMTFMEAVKSDWTVVKTANKNLAARCAAVAKYMFLEEATGRVDDNLKGLWDFVLSAKVNGYPIIRRTHVWVASNDFAREMLVENTPPPLKRQNACAFPVDDKRAKTLP